MYIAMVWKFIREPKEIVNEHFSRAEKRKKALAQRKRFKKAFRNKAKSLRMWSEYKRAIRQKYGYFVAFFCEPNFLLIFYHYTGGLRG